MTPDNLAAMFAPNLLVRQDPQKMMQMAKADGEALAIVLRQLPPLPSLGSTSVRPLSVSPSPPSISLVFSSCIFFAVATGSVCAV
eukprot:COSAG05_NODE_3434_length_2066_cov_4.394001_4_plen_85_part_00